MHCSLTQYRILTVDRYVHACIPTFLDRGSSNNTEEYSLLLDNKVHVVFSYTPSGSSVPSTIEQRATMANSFNTEWHIAIKLCCCFVPFNLVSLILDAAEDYSWVVIGLPDRSGIWVMTRQDQQQASALVDRLVNTAVVEMKYNRDDIQRVSLPPASASIQSIHPST